MPQHAPGSRPGRPSLTKRINAELSSRAEAMVESSATHRGTRRRALAPAAMGFAALTGLFGMVSQNALAVNFTAMDGGYKVYSDKITGTDGAGFIDAQQTSSDGPIGVTEMGFLEAKLNGMCSIATQDLPLGTVSLIIRAGESVDGTLDPDGPTAISATNLFLASPSIMGNGDQIAQLSLGQSADTVRMGSDPFPAGMSPQAGAFGLQAKTLTISDLKSESYGIDLKGEINLPALKMQVVPGTATYADCAGLTTETP